MIVRRRVPSFQGKRHRRLVEEKLFGGEELQAAVEREFCTAQRSDTWSQWARAVDAKMRQRHQARKEGHVLRSVSLWSPARPAASPM